jgi:glycosyltransferase involved in cell wall biosynthesis
MHILFLSHYFPPEVNAPASRTFEHCRQWVEDGDDVTVLTCFPNHPAGKLYPGFRNRLFHRSSWHNMQVIRLLTYITPNEGFLKRSANYVFYMLVAILASIFVRRVDVVMTTSPQFFNGIAGYFVSMLKRAPWVLEIRDLWPESILELGAIRNRHIIRLLEAMAHFAYRKADHIVVVTEAFKRHIVELGIDPDKITVLKNGVDLSLFKKTERDPDFANSIGLGGRFIVSYVGTHGLAHGLETVLEAAHILRDRKDIGFMLVGDGAAKRGLLTMCAERDLKNVVMLDQQDRSRMPAIWAASDACLVVLRDKPVFRTVIPSKIFEIMAMRSPIILGVAGESQDIVQQAGAGLCVQPENAQALADAVVTLSDNPSFAASLGIQGFDYVVRYHDRVALARRYAALLKGAVALQRPVQNTDALNTE